MRVLLTRFVAGAFFFAADTVLAVVAFLAGAFLAGTFLAGAATAATFFAGAADAAETLIIGESNDAVMSAAV